MRWEGLPHPLFSEFISTLQNYRRTPRLGNWVYSLGPVKGLRKYPETRPVCGDSYHSVPSGQRGTPTLDTQVPGIRPPTFFSFQKGSVIFLSPEFSDRLQSPVIVGAKDRTNLKDVVSEPCFGKMLLSPRLPTKTSVTHHFMFIISGVSE